MTRTQRRAITMLAATAVATLAGAANAQTSLVSWTLNDLGATYDGAGNFTANAVGSATSPVTPLRTWAVASRNVPVVGDAFFAPDFVSNVANPANFTLNMAISNIGVAQADGVGTFVFTDVNGDTISGQILGLQSQSAGWLELLPGMFAFNGILQNVVFGNNSGDNAFDGTDGGNWLLNLPGQSPFEGAIVNLVFPAQPGLFQNAFENNASSLTAQIIPAPGALALLAAGGLVAGRRRR